jgi:DNA modification methylase
MTNARLPAQAWIKPTAGIKSQLKQKTKQRRQWLNALTTIERHAPRRRNDLLPRLSISYIPIERIRPSDKRVRKQDAVQIARVSASISKFGVVVPLIVDEQYQIVHGNAVYEAAVDLGLTELPAVSLSHLDEPQLRLLSITLNNLGETGSWDEEVLRIEFEELISLDEDVFVTGFEAPQIDALLLDDCDVETDEVGVEFPSLASPVSRPGDIWLLGRHRLLQGDARSPDSYAALMLSGEQARIVLTDTPFNVPNAGHVTSQTHHREFAMAAGEMSREEFGTFSRQWLMASATHVVDGGLIATFIDWRSVELVLASGRELGFELLNLITWVKSNGGQGSFWRSQHELLPVFKKGKAPHVNNVELGRFGRWRSNVWSYPGASTLGSDAREGLASHPTVKPRALLADALLDVSNRDEIVLEPFAGSGSTLLAAERVGRICRAIEIDGLYCDLAIRRWQELSGEDAILAETGESFRSITERNAAHGEEA